MCRVMATYPLAQMARITAMTSNAAGMPVSPVVAYAVGMTPAATVSGATLARTKDSTAGTPSRSRASARDTLLGLRPAVCVLDIMRLLGSRGSGVGSALHAVGEQGTVYGGLGLGDQFPQDGIKLGCRLVETAVGVGREIKRQPVAQPAGSGEPAEGRVLGSHRPGCAQRGVHAGQRRECAVSVHRNPAFSAA